MTATAMSTIRSGATLWNQLEEAGMTGIDEVTTIFPGIWFQVVSIEQQYPGHSTQVGLQAMSLPAGSWEGRITIVVDEDIDPSDLDSVLWAMCTRCDPVRDVEIHERTHGSDADPLVTDGEAAFNSRAIVDATIPYERREDFPPVAQAPPEYYDQVREKWKAELGL